ncbi:MAG: SDR family NAD(P)-dependent oxidoreductase, partial [Solobacterium sp.]|nr:SDR family NAD(P)-dependent oxidoreductase [Solobacterium sp.]
MFDISNTCLKKGCLEGEVAVITGSTSNVGKGFAQAIAWAGGKVVIVGRGAERGKAVADEINADNGEGTAIFVQADVSNADDIARLKEEAYAAFG